MLHDAGIFILIVPQQFRDIIDVFSLAGFLAEGGKNAILLVEYFRFAIVLNIK
jgi:hypothetical protein